MVNKHLKKDHAERDYKVILAVEMRKNNNIDGEQTPKNNAGFLLKCEYFQEYAEKLRAEFEQEKKRAVNVATR